eukprot:TRINITY_DN144147_c0_g1_i1.p3 TRINITY_DN144147_c0_g1~~TRINITY_DN144147_c0_g1_i1.p3  ORF type:complete len:104 (+),score=20.69 TRINITY_DN144147_c0_g1_i1:316-627(+)
MLSSREVRANVVNKLHNEFSESANEAVFDRWERDVMCSEYKDSASFFQGSDSDADCQLAKEFELAEESEDLLRALDELKKENSSEGEQNEKKKKKKKIGKAHV